MMRPRTVLVIRALGLWAWTLGVVASAALTVATIRCAHVPPNLGPAGQLAWRQHEIQKDLDLIRDLAIDANAQVPPLVSTATTRQIVLWHKTTITLVHDAPQGWQALVLKGLADLQGNLPAAEYGVIAPYVTIAMTIVRSVQP